jgi:hypothetical protein
MEYPYRRHMNTTFTLKQLELYSSKDLCPFYQLGDKTVRKTRKLYNVQTANIRAVITTSPR